MGVEACKINTAVNHYELLFYHYPHSDDDANSSTDNTALLGFSDPMRRILQVLYLTKQHRGGALGHLGQ